MLADIKNKLLKAFPDATIELEEGYFDGRHLNIIITSARFKGLSLLEQHRLVQNALKEFLDTEAIHAVKIKTKIKE